MLPTTRDGLYRLDELDQPALFEPTVDPRFVEYLPWVPMERGVALPLEFATFQPFMMAALMGTLIYVIPIAWLWGAVARRRWSLRRWLLLPVVVGVALASVQSFAANPTVVKESMGSPLLLALGFAAIGATMMLFPIELGILVTRRRYIGAVVLIGLSLVIAAVWGIWSMQLASAAFAPGQSFRYDGWYVIWFSGAYAAGFVGIVVEVARWIVRRWTVTRTS